MTTLTFKRNLGITLDNIPDSILRHCQGNVMARNGDISFSVEYSAGTASSITQAVREFVGRPILESWGTSASFLDIDIPTPAPIPMEEEVEHCPECEEEIDDCSCERCEGCNALVRMCTCRPDVRDVEANGSSDAGLQEAAVDNHIEGDRNIKVLVAANMNTDTASKAKIMSDKIRDYNRALATVLALSNEIARLESLVSVDPVVDNMMMKISRLRNSPMIEDIYFTNRFLVVNTGELVTGELSDGFKRKIGKMSFLIRLTALVGNVVGESYPILIRNRTREIGGRHCGHVYRNGTSCFGSWTQPIVEAMQSKDLCFLTDILVRFVKTPNESDSMGVYMRQWPKVEETA